MAGAVAITAGDLRAHFVRSGARARRMTFLLVLPLLAFLAVTFIIPIGDMLMRSVDDPTIAQILPRTADTLRAWDGKGRPPYSAYAALASDLEVAQREGTVGKAATRMNFEVPGMRSMLMATARVAGKFEPPYAQAFNQADPRLKAVFLSRNAVEHGLARVREFGVRASLPQAAAVGAGTAKALESEGVEGVAAPAGPADSEALLALPQFQAMEGRQVLVFRGVGGREWLAAALRSRGAVVDYAECYRRGVPATDLRPLIADWASGGVDAVTVSSREGLANLAGLLGEAGLAHLRTTPAFVPHARVADEARALGIANVTVAGASDEEMLGALVAYFGRAG